MDEKSLMSGRHSPMTEHLERGLRRIWPLHHFACAFSSLALCSAVLVAGIIMSACGGSKTVSPQAQTDAGLSDAPLDSGGGHGDAGAEGPNANCNSTDVATSGVAIATENGGYVIITAGQDVYFGPQYTEHSGTVEASFYRAGQRKDPWQWLCEPTVIGPCAVWTDACDEAGPCNVPIPSAGVITLGGSPFLDGSMDRPNSTGTYTLSNYLTDPIYSVGDILTVSAAGAEVPPFQQNVVAPGCVALSAPASPDGGAIYGSYVISTAADFQVFWTGGEPDASVSVTLTGQRGNNPPRVTVSCRFDATLGQGAIPQQALAPLTGDSGGFMIYQERRSSVQAGLYDVDVIVRNAGCSSPDAGVCPANNASAVFE